MKILFIRIVQVWIIRGQWTLAVECGCTRRLVEVKYIETKGFVFPCVNEMEIPK